MAAGFGYGGFSGLSYPFYIPPPYPYPPASTPPFLPTHPVESSYDQTQGGFHPTIPHRSYHQTPSYDDNSPPLTTPSSFYTQPDNFSLRSEDFPPLTPPSSSYYAQPGNYGPRSEDSCKDMGGYYPSMEPSSSNAVYYPPMARQRLVWPPYSSATVSSLANMLIRNSHEPFFLPIPPSGVCVSSHALALNRPTHYYPGYDNADISGPPLPFLPVPSLNTQGSTGSWNPLSSQPLQFNAQSSGSLYTEKGEASGVSSLYQRPNTLVAHSENRSSEGISAPTMVSMGSESCGAVETDKGNANQLSEDVQVQEQLVDIMNRVKKTTLSTDVSIKGSSLSNADGVSTSQSPICDQGGFTSPASFKRVSTVVNAMHKLSEVLVNECFRNRSLLKPEQLESLDIVVEKLAKCLKKMTANKTITGEEASVPTQAVHVSCPNVVDLNETPNVVAKDCQGVNGKPLDNFGVKELVDKDKNEMMTQSIKNILASNFPDGEENHPKTLLYKNLWLETEAALSSRTCLARYHRIQNETGNLKLQDEEISADESTLKQEPFLNPEESDSIMNIVEQETTESLTKDGSTFGNNVVTMSHDAPQSSRFNSAPVEAVLSLMSRSFTGSLEQETIRKLKSQNCSETRMDEQEDNPDASEMATFGRSSYMSDAMGRLQLLKRPEAEQVQKPLNSVDFDSDSGSDFASDSGSEFDSDSDNDQPRNKIQMYDYLWPGSMMTIGGNSKIETCANTKPSADGKGYDSPTSDWEHVLMDD